METLSAEEFKKRYGTMGVAAFNPPQQGGFGNTVKNYFKSTISGAFKGGTEKMKAGAQQINRNNPFEGGIKLAAGAIEAASSPLAPIFKPVGDAVNYGADKLSDNPSFQKFASSKAGGVAERVASNVQDLSTIAGAVGGAKVTRNVARGVKAGVSNAAENVANTAKNIKMPNLGKAKGTVGELVPSGNRIVNQQVAKALNINETDLRNIHQSTGNDIGTFMAERNLIGDNLETTKAGLTQYFDDNYKAVRAEIGNVKKTYSKSEVPRYEQALTELTKETAGVPGLEKSSAEINALINKKKIELVDVQKAKELIDKHYKLYNNLGDVKTGVAKQGLDVIRKDLRKFIEAEVKKETGADIGEMNNNVSTSKGILDAMELRSTRGLTNYNLSMRDLGLFAGGSLAGTPLLGAALVLGELLLRSPSMRLKIAKWVAKLPEPQQAKIKAQLESGQVPQEFFDAGFVRKKVPNQPNNK